MAISDYVNQASAYGKSKATLAMEQAQKLKASGLSEVAKKQAVNTAAHISASKGYAGIKAGKYHGKAALIGAAAGLLKTNTDSDNDGPISTAANVGTAAGVMYGASKGAEWLSNNQKAKDGLTDGLLGLVKGKQDSKDVATRAAEHSTVSVGKDVVPVEVNQRAATNMQKQAYLKKAGNFTGKLGMMTAIGATFIGVAGIMDVSDELRQKTRSDRMVAVQEENLINKRNKQKETRQELGYGNVNMGQLAIDMFNERIGHHKMGNSKFQ